jgi:hypothetical protein
VSDDKAKPDAVRLENGRGRRGDTLSITLGAGGGFVARFIK